MRWSLNLGLLPFTHLLRWWVDPFNEEGGEFDRRRLAQLERHKTQLNEELAILSRQIDQEYDPVRQSSLCLVYEALQWARNPNGFARPSTCIATTATRSVTRARPNLRIVK